MITAEKKYGLSKDERIKSRKDFEIVFARGLVILSNDRKLKAIFLSEPQKPGRIRMAVAISGKTGMAIWRNRIKRIIKECYRFNKEILNEVCIDKDIYLRLIISPYSLNQKNSSSIKLKDIEASLIELLKKVKKII